MLVPALATMMLAVQAAPSAPVEESAVRWLERPMPISDDYPLIARHLRLAGRAVVECDADARGVPLNCQAVTSTPPNLGFDQAAVNIVQRARVTPTPNTDGHRRFRVSVPFRILPREQAEPLSGPAPTPTQLQGGRRFAVATVTPRPDMFARLKQTWRMDRLPLEQQQALEAWINELAPTRDQEIAQTADAVSRVLAKYGLDEWPRQRPDNHEAIGRDLDQALNREDMMATISQRYCAAFTCLND